MSATLIEKCRMIVPEDENPPIHEKEDENRLIDETRVGGRLCFRSLPRSVRPGHQQRDVQDQKHGATGGSNSYVLVSLPW